MKHSFMCQTICLSLVAVSGLKTSMRNLPETGKGMRSPNPRGKVGMMNLPLQPSLSPSISLEPTASHLPSTNPSRSPTLSPGISNLPSTGPSQSNEPTACSGTGNSGSMSRKAKLSSGNNGKGAKISKGGSEYYETHFPSDFQASSPTGTTPTTYDFYGKSRKSFQASSPTGTTPTTYDFYGKSRKSSSSSNKSKSNTRETCDEDEASEAYTTAITLSSLVATTDTGNSSGTAANATFKMTTFAFTLLSMFIYV